MTEQERVAVEEAFAEELKQLFSVLCLGLEDPLTEDAEGKFAKGVKIAREARIAALSIIKQ